MLRHFNIVCTGANGQAVVASVSSQDAELAFDALVFQADKANGSDVYIGAAADGPTSPTNHAVRLAPSSAPIEGNLAVPLQRSIGAVLRLRDVEVQGPAGHTIHIFGVVS